MPGEGSSANGRAAGPHDLDIDWGTVINVAPDEDAAPEPYWISLDTRNVTLRNPDVFDLLACLAIDPSIPDGRAKWQHKAYPLHAWLRLHLLGLVLGWDGEKDLAQHFDQHPEQALCYGFYRTDGESEAVRPSPPSKSRLNQLRNHDFPDDLLRECERVADELGEVIRDHGIDVPDDWVWCEESPDEDDAPERTQKRDSIRDNWKTVKPIAHRFGLGRAENAEIPLGGYLEQHAHLSESNKSAESGHEDFLSDTTRDEENVPTGSPHRWMFRGLSVADQRDRYTKIVKALLKESDAFSTIRGEIILFIDQTPGRDYTGEIECDSDGDPNDPFVLRTKDGTFAFRFATIQICNPECPLPLDQIPVIRGMSKQTIVEQLLDSATDILQLAGIEIAVMDRGFDAQGVKRACEKHGIRYLNPRRRMDAEKGIIKDLREDDRKVHCEITEQADAPPRAKFFIKVKDLDGGDTDATSEDANTVESPSLADHQKLEDSVSEELGFDITGPDPVGASWDDEQPPDVYEMLRRELEEVAGIQLTDRSASEDAARDGNRQPFGDVIGAMRDERVDEEEPVAGEADAASDEEATGERAETGGNDDEDEDDEEDYSDYIVFETNHPYVTERYDEELSEAEKLHLVARMLRRYYSKRNRIERGYEDAKQYLADTTSDCPRYRFFCFLFACLVYDFWRVVDELVKLAIKDDPDLTVPYVNKVEFGAVVDEYFAGLDPPD